MLKYLSEYVNKFEEELNVPLMNKEADEPLVEYIKDAWKSLEVASLSILRMKQKLISTGIFLNEKNERKRKIGWTTSLFRTPDVGV